MLAVNDSEWKQLIEQLKLLPPLSPIAGLLMTRLNDEFITIQEVIELVKQDSAITARLIKLANSALYQWPSPIESIDAAVTKVLGLDTTCAVSLGIAFSKSLNASKCPNLDQTALWTETLLFAKCTKKIVADHFGSEELAAIAYTGALLTNLGILTLATLEPVRFNKCLGHDLEQTLDQLIQLEFQCDHHHLAGELARSWELPNNLLPLITLQPADAVSPYTEMTQFAMRLKVIVAEFIADGEAPAIESQPAADFESTTLDSLLTLLAKNHKQSIAVANAMTALS